jgi:hypothetical protein
VREQAPQIARARAIAVTKTAPTHRLQPGDLICGNCGEGNAPARKFCSRCGSSLIEAAVITKIPWWRRIRIRRGPKVVKLGAEKGRTASGTHIRAPGFNPRHLASQIYRKARVVVAIAVVAGGAIYGIYPPFRTDVNSVFHAGKAKVSAFTAKPEQVTIGHCSATTAVPGHPGSDLCDGVSNNYWEAPYSASSKPIITMKFEYPVHLTSMIVLSGAVGAAYDQNGRPMFLKLVYSNDETDEVSVVDTPSQQTITLKHSVLVKSVQIEVPSIYAGQVNSSDVAIRQIELFGYRLG